MTWIVRWITWVRTSIAGLRAARVAVDVPVAGLSANAAKPPAAAARTIAAIRECLLRIGSASDSWGRGDSAVRRVTNAASEGKHLANPTIFLARRSDLFTRGQQACPR
jgi:hypothetical protein